MNLTGRSAILSYILAGNASFTIRNANTGAHLTYKISGSRKRPGVDFVSVLTQADNDESYEYIGVIRDGTIFEYSAKSRISEEAHSVRVWRQFWAALKANTLPSHIEVLHSGQCGRCGRQLTDPESIATGLGPVCVSLATV